MSNEVRTSIIVRVHLQNKTSPSIYLMPIFKYTETKEHDQKIQFSYITFTTSLNPH